MFSHAHTTTQLAIWRARRRNVTCITHGLGLLVVLTRPCTGSSVRSWNRSRTARDQSGRTVELARVFNMACPNRDLINFRPSRHRIVFELNTYRVVKDQRFESTGNMPAGMQKHPKHAGDWCTHTQPNTFKYFYISSTTSRY